MALNDLNLEFEDEEEAKKPKKSDALAVDVDLEFQSPGQELKPRPAPRPPGGPAGAAPVPSASKPPLAEVKKIDEAKRPVAAPSPRPAPAVAEGSKTADQELEIVKEQLRKVEFEASVKIHVAEFKVEILSQVLGDMKLMEHQIGQLLARMNAKHPDLKAEALTIKKILADFTAKKRI